MFKLKFIKKKKKKSCACVSETEKSVLAAILASLCMKRAIMCRACHWLVPFASLSIFSVTSNFTSNLSLSLSHAQETHSFLEYTCKGHKIHV